MIEMRLEKLVRIYNVCKKQNGCLKCSIKKEFSICPLYITPTFNIGLQDVNVEINMNLCQLLQRIEKEIEKYE